MKLTLQYEKSDGPSWTAMVLGLALIAALTVLGYALVTADGRAKFEHGDAVVEVDAMTVERSNSD